MKKVIVVKIKGMPFKTLVEKHKTIGDLRKTYSDMGINFRVLVKKWKNK